MILIVDDNDHVARALRRVLQKRGYDVEVASDGLGAYKHLKAGDCDCMLLDMRMPKISGAELLMLMQADGIAVPTIIMAGFQDFDDQELKQFDNVVEYFHKPLEADAVVKAIQSCTSPVATTC